jgi:hypothetical protein
MAPERMFGHPTSVLLCGSSRSLLNWAAYAFALTEVPEFTWVDVRHRGQAPAAGGPLACNMVPPEQLHVLETTDLPRNDAVSNMAIAGVIRTDEPPDDVRLLVDFLRLPSRIQELLSSARTEGRPRMLVVSNAHRMATYYPAEAVAPVVRAVVKTGAILFMTFADAPSEGHEAFETILYLEGNDPKEWKRAILRAAKGPLDGPFQTGSEYRLVELEPVAAVLARDLK